MSATRTMTAEEYFAMPDPDPSDTRRTQLIEGEIVWFSQPDFLHGELQARLLVSLRNWIKDGSDRGSVHLPGDIQLNELNVYGPDINWYSEPRKPDIRSPRPYPMPDIVAEVRSPSTWRYDIGAKKRNYEAEGLRELWLVDSAGEVILVYRRSRPEAPDFDVELELAEGESLTSQQLDGFALDVAELFAD